jgi:hypothetical protein
MLKMGRRRDKAAAFHSPHFQQICSEFETLSVVVNAPTLNKKPIHIFTNGPLSLFTSSDQANIELL